LPTLQQQRDLIFVLLCSNSLQCLTVTLPQQLRGVAKFFLEAKFLLKYIKFGQQKILILSNLKAKLKFKAPIIFSVSNLRLSNLSVKKLQLSASVHSVIGRRPSPYDLFTLAFALVTSIAQFFCKFSSSVPRYRANKLFEMKT